MITPKSIMLFFCNLKQILQSGQIILNGYGIFSADATKARERGFLHYIYAEHIQISPGDIRNSLLISFPDYHTYLVKKATDISLETECYLRPRYPNQ